MAAKGYKKVSNDADAKFYVRYYLGTQTQTSYMTTSMGAGPGYGWGWGGGMGVSTTQPIETTQGNVIVDLVQMGTNTLVWRGTMTGDLSNKAPTQQQINNSAAKVMAGLPPAGGAPPKKLASACATSERARADRAGPFGVQASSRRGRSGPRRSTPRSAGRARG